MIIANAWYVKQLPNAFVIELPDGELEFAFHTPVRKITDADLQPYKGYRPNPSRMRGTSDVPEYMCNFYGFEKA